MAHRREIVLYDRVMRAKWLWLTVALILVAVAGAIIQLWTNTRRQKVNEAAVVQSMPPAQPAVIEISATGKLEAQHVISIAAPMEGHLVNLAVEPGQDVFEGQLIARIESAGVDSENEDAAGDVERATSRISDLQRQISTQRLEASRASAEAARAGDEAERLQKTYLRQQMLVREGATPRLVFEKAEREYQGAQKTQDALREVTNRETAKLSDLTNGLEQAEKMLTNKATELEQVRTTLAAGQVFSPANGVFLSSRARPGENVDRDMRDLFRIATDLQALQVQVSLNGEEAAKVRSGMPALINIAEAGPDAIAGTVTEVKPDSAVIQFTNESPAVRPGLMVQVRIRLT